MWRMGAVKEVYFDTNAFSDLFRPDSDLRGQALRRDIRAATRSGKFSLVTSVWVLDELGGLAADRWELYRKVMRFLLENVGVVFDETVNLVMKEVRLNRRLKGLERAVDPATLASVTASLGLEREAVIRAYEAHRKRSRERLHEQQIQRQETLARLLSSGYDTREAMRDWSGRSPQLLDSWAREVLDGVMAAHGQPPLPADESLQRVPSAVNYVAISLARIAWYLGEGRRIEAGDDADAHHYTGACYADAFVSSDDRLRQICDLVPDARIRPVAMDEFAREYLGWT
jgi:predicted nucleic acid-binding protein